MLERSKRGENAGTGIEDGINREKKRKVEINKEIRTGEVGGIF